MKNKKTVYKVNTTTRSGTPSEKIAELEKLIHQINCAEIALGPSIGRQVERASYRLEIKKLTDINENKISKVAMAAEVMEALKFIYPENLYGPERYGVEFGKLRVAMSLEKIHRHLGERLAGSDGQIN